MTDQEPCNAVLGIKVTPTEKAQFCALAKQENLTPSNFGRILIQNRIDNKEQALQSLLKQADQKAKERKILEEEENALRQKIESIKVEVRQKEEQRKRELEEKTLFKEADKELEILYHVLDGRKNDLPNVDWIGEKIIDAAVKIPIDCLERYIKREIPKITLKLKLKRYLPSMIETLEESFLTNIGTEQWSAKCKQFKIREKNRRHKMGVIG